MAVEHVFLNWLILQKYTHNYVYALYLESHSEGPDWFWAPGC